MLHSGFVGAYGRADGFGGSQVRCSSSSASASLNNRIFPSYMSNSPQPSPCHCCFTTRSPQRPKPSSLATAARQSQLAATSAFHAPLPSHPRSSLAAAAAAAAYGAPNHLNERNPSSLQMRLGSSPTSVDASPALFGGDGLSHMSAHHHRHRQRLAVHRTFQPVSFEHLHGAHVTTPLAAKDIQARPRDVAHLCLPCEPTAAAVAPTPVRPTARNADSAKVNKAQGSHGRRSSTHGPGIAAGDGGERPSGGGDGRPTPQNLKDNPERQAKVKTEMCRYYEEGKKCRYGIHCELPFPGIWETILDIVPSFVQNVWCDTHTSSAFILYLNTQLPTNRQLRPWQARAEVPLHDPAPHGEFRADCVCQYVPRSALHDLGLDGSLVSNAPRFSINTRSVSLLY